MGQKNTIKRKQLFGRAIFHCLAMLCCVFISGLFLFKIVDLVLNKREYLQVTGWLGVIFICVVVITVFGGYIGLVLTRVVEEIRFRGLEFGDEGIRILTKRGSYLIRRDEIGKILDGDPAMMLIWEIEGMPTTFVLRKYLFEKDEFEKVREYLRGFGGYTNSAEEIRIICRHLKLDDLFRRNRFEYKLGKL